MWLAIDSLKFDEFFIMPFVVFIGIIYTVNSTVDSDSIGDGNEIE